MSLSLKQLLVEDECARALDQIVAHSGLLWSRDLFPDPWAVIHGIPHSEAIIQRLQELLKRYLQEHTLSQAEILVLLGSAYLHDVGYLPQKGERIITPKNPHPRLKKGERIYEFDHAKKEHPQRGHDYIKNHLAQCGGAHYGPLIALCTKQHREVPTKEGLFKDRATPNGPARLQFLTALLRLADELDVGEARAPKPFFEMIKSAYGVLPHQTVLQWMRHYYTEGIELRPIKRNGMQIQITINSFVPFDEYARYIVDPYIVRPVKTAILDSAYALASEYLFVTAKEPYIETVPPPDKEPLPENVYTYFKTLFLERESLRNLMRYDYVRVCKYKGPLHKKDSVFRSPVVRVRNSLGYTLVNNSAKKNYVSGTGVFGSMSTDIYEKTPLGLGPNFVKDRLGFSMKLIRNKKSQKITFEYLDANKHPELGNTSVDNAVAMLGKFKPFKKKVFCVSDIKEVDDLRTITARLLYLDPIKPAESLRFEFAYASTMLPWDAFSAALRYPTKGLKIRFETFPKSYLFTRSCSLLIERGDKLGAEQEPSFERVKGEQARKYASNHLLAPGTHIVVQWADKSLRLRP